MKNIKFKKLKMDKGFWFIVEYFENSVLKLGEGCHFSEKEKMTRIKEKFKKLLK